MIITPILPLFTTFEREGLKVTGPTAPELKKLTSLNLCYLGLYHRKSILSFSTLHLKEICTR